MKNRFDSGPRREFVFIIILLAVPLVVRAADRNSPQPFDISPRQESSFSTGWVFVPSEKPGVEKADFDDAAFERVSVPHANIMVPHETFDPDTFRFVAWYRKHFISNRQWEGRTVEVEFQGVMTVADVYLNGRLLGHHAGGYTRSPWISRQRSISTRKMFFPFGWTQPSRDKYRPKVRKRCLGTIFLVASNAT